MEPVATPTAPPRRNRPLGVTILAVIMALLGVILLLVGLVGLVLVIGSVIIPVGLAGFQFFGLSASLGFAILFLLGIVTLVLAVGLWHQREWALILAIIILLIEAASGIYSFVKGGSTAYGDLTTPVIEILILLYLVAVRRHFH